MALIHRKQSIHVYFSVWSKCFDRDFHSQFPFAILMVIVVCLHSYVDLTTKKIFIVTIRVSLLCGRSFVLPQ